MMTLRQRYRRLTLWNKMGFWGSVASLVGVLIALLTVVFGGGSPTTTGDQSPVITRNRGDVKVIYGITEDDLITEIGVTRAALKSFFKILEKRQVPPEDLPVKLREIAKHYKELFTRLQRLDVDDPEMAALRQAADTALRAGDLAQAEHVLNLADQRGREVYKILLQEHKRLETRERKNRLDRAAVKAALGDLKHTQLAYVEAAGYYREAAGLVAEDDAKTQATYLHDEGTAWWQAGQYAKALSPLEQALHLRENALGSEHPDVASSLNSLALLYQAQGLYDQAEPLYKRPLAIGEKVLGPDHPGVAIRLNNLAELYRVQGLYDQAEPLSKRALAIDEKVLGPDHPGVATDLNNLAGLYQTQGLYDQAEPLSKRALAIHEKVLGPDHPNTLTILRNYLHLLSVTNRVTEAKALLARLQALQPKRAWLGIGLKSQDNPAGILVTQVIENGPAAQSGVEPNDLIVRLNGSDVYDTQAFIQAVGAIPPETTVEIDVIRRGQHHTMSVTLGLRPVVMPKQ